LTSHLNESRSGQGWASCDDLAVGPAEGSGVPDSRDTRPGAVGIVSRPRLSARLGAAQRVTVVSAPPGSGKTILLRSWITEAGLAKSVAWVSAGGEERDPQRFWLSVLGALRQTTAGSALVRELTAAPDLDGWAIAERLLKDLVPLEDRIWLVIDDLHELGSGEARRQLELLVMRAPEQLRFVLATRHDLRLGLHRLRLEGRLTEIREPDLRFTVAEAQKLVSAAGVELTEPTLALLHERTEGWAAGLRLAALSLAGHPDPGRFAEEFSGSERTVAEYLLAEVLERQSHKVRRLLLRTSILDRVSGELADLLTEGSGGERILQDLEEANAFVVALDEARSWFRYHHLFADLLQLELRRTVPDEVTALHQVATSGLPSTGTLSRRSATPRPRRTGAWPHACLPTTGQACSWAGTPRPCTSSSPGSPPRPPQHMPSSPCSSRPTNWLRGRSKRRSGIWGSQPGGGRRRRTTGMTSCRFCSR
jgi:LuxR family transcriptional regulator, maltose regulon positive regulatory protein